MTSKKSCIKKKFRKNEEMAEKWEKIGKKFHIKLKEIFGGINKEKNSEKMKEKQNGEKRVGNG